MRWRLALASGKMANILLKSTQEAHDFRHRRNLEELVIAYLAGLAAFDA